MRTFLNRFIVVALTLVLGIDPLTGLAPDRVLSISRRPASFAFTDQALETPPLWLRFTGSIGRRWRRIVSGKKPLLHDVQWLVNLISPGKLEFAWAQNGLAVLRPWMLFSLERGRPARTNASEAQGFRYRPRDEWHYLLLSNEAETEVAAFQDFLAKQVEPVPSYIVELYAHMLKQFESRQQMEFRRIGGLVIDDQGAKLLQDYFDSNAPKNRGSFVEIISPYSNDTLPDQEEYSFDFVATPALFRWTPETRETDEVRLRHLLAWLKPYRVLFDISDASHPSLAKEKIPESVGIDPYRTHPPKKGKQFHIDSYMRSERLIPPRTAAPPVRQMNSLKKSA